MKIILAEDSILLQAGLAKLLEHAGHEIIQTVTNAAALVKAVNNQLPDLIITDVRIPERANIEQETTNLSAGLVAALEIRKQYPQLPVLVLSQYVATAYAKQLLESGSSVGYLLKERVGRVDTFLQTIETIHSGGVCFDPEIITSLLQEKKTTDQISSLTPREYEVLGLIANGKSNQEIMDKLVITEAAVAKHIANIFTKLGLGTEENNRRVKAVLMFLASQRQSL